MVKGSVLWYNSGMRRVFLIILVLWFCIPVFAEEQTEDVKLPNIFIWTLPEEKNVSPDDITSSNEEEEVSTVPEPEDINALDYEQYVDAADVVYLKDEENNFVLNLTVPQKFESKNIVDTKKIHPKSRKTYSMYSNEEYSIAPQSVQSVEKHGNFSLGTLYNTGIDNSQLERSTTLFTRYEREHFAISSAFKKNNLTTYGLNTDNFYIAPELKLNKMFSFSPVLSTDITRNRRKGEFVLSVNPLKDDRMKLEFGAGTTYDINNDRSWSQIRFNTKFQL